MLVVHGVGIVMDTFFVSCSLKTHSLLITPVFSYATIVLSFTVFRID